MKPLVISQSRPARRDEWEERCTPVGCGSLGASILGGAEVETVFLNEKTLWTGGPGVPGHRFGNHHADDEVTRQRWLAEVQSRLAQGPVAPLEPVVGGSTVMDLLGEPRVGYGSYQSFGVVTIDHRRSGTGASRAEGDQYWRQLDLRTGIATVQSRLGARWARRELFATHVDQVVVGTVELDEPTLVRFSLDPNLLGHGPAEALSGASITADDCGITLTATSPDNGLRAAARLELVTDAEVRVEGSNLVVETSSLWWMWTAATDYAPHHPMYRTGEDDAAVLGRVLDRLTGARQRGLASIRADHVADVSTLMGRVEIDLDGAELTDPTDVLVAAVGRDAATDRALVELHAQYGRHLLVASSRPGSLPASLQGVWCADNASPWGSDYHTNINLQMNYWPAWSANLGETTEPLLAFVENLAQAGTSSARSLFGVDDAWVVNNETTPFGYTGVHDWPTAAWFPEAAAWCAQHLWWDWLYSRDLERLRERTWPVLAGAARLWLATLTADPRDGSLVASPSYSPEHGPYVAGAAMSQQIIDELFTTVLEAADVLDMDDEIVGAVARAQEHLDRGLHVALTPEGNPVVLEWKDTAIEWAEHAIEPDHRHTSHLYALWPGRALQPQSRPDLAAAARGTLLRRGDGGTGWSMAWKIGFWAHLGDGDHARLMYQHLLRDSTLPNLWDTHPPFQIDGNFGATAALCEMVVQNIPTDSGVLSLALLPALPTDWPRGEVRGIRAWGGVVVDLSWSGGRLRSATLTSCRDVEVMVSGWDDIPILRQLQAGEPLRLVR